MARGAVAVTITTTLTVHQADVLRALWLGGRVLYRDRRAPTLHDPDTGRYVAMLAGSTLCSLHARGLVRGSTTTGRRVAGIITLTDAGREAAESLLEEPDRGEA